MLGVRRWARPRRLSAARNRPCGRGIGRSSFILHPSSCHLVTLSPLHLFTLVRQAGLAFVAVIFLCIAANAEKRPPVVIETDLYGDGQKERIELNAARDPSVSVRRGDRLLWRGMPKRWRPWKLVVADVDGDGRKEIVVGLFKSTRYMPQPHATLFVYGFDGETVYPKWLGSTLGRPFTDFACADLNGDGRDELIVLSIRLDARRCVGAYAWNGFGFDKIWERGAWRKVRLLSANREAIIVQADGKKIALRRNGK